VCSTLLLRVFTAYFVCAILAVYFLFLFRFYLLSDGAVLVERIYLSVLNIIPVEVLL